MSNESFERLLQQIEKTDIVDNSPAAQRLRGIDDTLRELVGDRRISSAIIKVYEEPALVLDPNDQHAILTLGFEGDILYYSKPDARINQGKGVATSFQLREVTENHLKANPQFAHVGLFKGKMAFIDPQGDLLAVHLLQSQFEQVSPQSIMETLEQSLRNSLEAKKPA